MACHFYYHLSLNRISRECRCLGLPVAVAVAVVAVAISKTTQIFFM